MVKKIDDTGNRYGRLLVQSCFVKNGITHCVCLCDCGNTVTVRAGSIRRRNNSTKSCGCLHKEVMKTVTKKNITHGETNTQTYHAWICIKSRCYNPNLSNYSDYGGRGISMYPAWKDDYIAFRDYIGHPPDDGQKYSVDRIDNNGNYEPGNVRWATDAQQGRNKRRGKANKTGVTGVCFTASYNVYTAIWRTLDGKRKTKTFSVNKYGEEEAFRLACEARENAIKELNAQGAGYSEDHGK